MTSQQINRLLLIRLEATLAARANYFKLNAEWIRWVQGMERKTGKKFA